MKKSDLNIGNVVETRNGVKLLLCDNQSLINLKGSGCRALNNWREDLTSADGYTEFDIIKVYKDYTLTKLLWERKEKPKLTEDEKFILWNLSEEYKWIVRDASGLIYAFTNKPFKNLNKWMGCDPLMCPFKYSFQFIKWEDEEPYSIEELLEGEENDF